MDFKSFGIARSTVPSHTIRLAAPPPSRKHRFKAGFIPTLIAAYLRQSPYLSSISLRVRTPSAVTSL